MNYHFLPDDFLSRRALTFSGVAAFHVLVAYLLLTAIVTPPAAVPDKPTVAFWNPPSDPVPAPATTDFRPGSSTAIPLPPTDPVAVAADPESAPALTTQTQPGSGPVTVPGPLPVRILGVNQLPNSEDYYPPDMRRQNVQGATNVRVCVDPQGRVLGEPTVEESSGYPRLDGGALNVVRHGRYARSMQGDAPVGNCFRFRIAFKMPK